VGFSYSSSSRRRRLVSTIPVEVFSISISCSISVSHGISFISVVPVITGEGFGSIGGGVPRSHPLRIERVNRESMRTIH
jgi:hypothetical protein